MESTRLGWTLFCCMLFMGQVTGDEVRFESQVAPILLENCVSCHGAKKAEGGFRLDTFEQLMKAGDSGDTPIVPSNIDKSEVYRRLIDRDHRSRMPAESEPLSPTQIGLIRDWIASGAKFQGKGPSDPLYLVIPPVQYPPRDEKYKSPLPVTALAFSKDGKQLFVSGYHEITLWNAEDGKLLKRIGDIPERVFAIAVSNDGQQLAVGCGIPGKLGEVRLIQIESAKVTQVIARSPDVVLDLAYSPDGNTLAVASADSLIRMIDIPSMSQTRTIASHADWVTAVAWSEDGSKLASASRDKSSKIFTAATGDLLMSYQGHAAPVRGVAFTSDGKHAVSSGGDGKWHRWEIESGKKIADVSTGGESFKLIRNGQEAYVASSGNTVRRIDLSKNKESFVYKGHQDWALSVAYHPSTNRLASGAHDGEVRIWDAKEGTSLQNWSASP